MNYNKPSVIISESISDKIDMSQFYDDHDSEDIMVSINFDDVEISGKISSFSLERPQRERDGFIIRFRFVSGYQNAKIAMFADEIDYITFSLLRSNMLLKTLTKADILFRKVKPLEQSNQCEYEFKIYSQRE